MATGPRFPINNHVLLAGTTALQGTGIHSIGGFPFTSYNFMPTRFYSRWVVIHVSWRKPPSATEETTGDGIHEFDVLCWNYGCVKHRGVAETRLCLLGQASAARWTHSAPKKEAQ